MSEVEIQNRGRTERLSRHTVSSKRYVIVGVEIYDLVRQSQYRRLGAMTCGRNEVEECSDLESFESMALGAAENSIGPRSYRIRLRKVRSCYEVDVNRGR